MKSTARALTEPAPASAAPDVIHLPDQRQRTKKVTSGSAKRQRHHLEQFRTDDAEHEALHARRREKGLSLGAFVMEATGIASGKISRPRIRRRRAAEDVAAYMQGLVSFNRANTLLNQQTHVANTLALFAEEHGAERLLAEVRELRRGVELLREQFAAPIAAIHAALGDEHEG